MKQIIIIWSYWTLFLIVCGGLVYMVNRSGSLPGVKKTQQVENQEPLKINEELLKIQGNKWIAAEEGSEWRPPVEKDSIPEKQTETVPKHEDVLSEGDPLTVQKTITDEKRADLKDLKVIEEIEKVNQESRTGTGLDK